MATALPGNPFLADTVLTASPERLLVMLYDRLALDLAHAEGAIDARDFSEAHERLIHAQAIITQLRSSLDLEIWPEGASLVLVYDYLLKLSVDANARKDSSVVVTLRELVAPLCEAWRGAALAQGR